MKKSTIVMIATAVVVWIALIAVVVSVAYSGEIFHQQEVVISDASPKVCKDVEPFSSISINSNDIVYSNATRLLIMQCDTISTPRVIYPQEIDEYLSYEVVDDSMKISFKQPELKPGVCSMVRFTGIPLSIILPSATKEISMHSNKNPIPLLLSGIKAEKISIAYIGNVDVYSSIIDSLDVKYEHYYTEYTLKLNETEIGYLKPRIDTRWSTDFTLMQDSAANSTVRCLDWNFNSKKKSPMLTLDRITVDNLEYEGDKISLVAKNNATVRQISLK